MIFGRYNTGKSSCLEDQMCETPSSKTNCNCKANLIVDDIHFMKNSFCIACFIFGHKWKSRKELKQWFEYLDNGATIKHERARYEEVTHCTRCGAENPRLK